MVLTKFYLKESIKRDYSFFCILVLCTLTIIVFSATFNNGFQTAWDDQWAVTGNPFVLNPNGYNFKILFTEFYYGQYAPLNVLFYSGLYELFGFNSGIFHGICLLVHLLNIILVFKLIENILRYIKPGYSDSRILVYASFVALIFGIHPLQVESVAWISASKIPLYSFFYLSSLMIYVKYLKDSEYKWLGLIIIFFIISLGFKEQAIILPFTLFALDYLYDRLRFKKIRLSFLTSRVLLEKTPFFLIALAFWYFSAQFDVGSLEVANAYPFDQRIFLGAQSFMEYIFRFIAPVKLFFFYHFPFEIGGQTPNYFWVYILLMLIVVGFFFYNFSKSNRIVVFGFLFFLINIGLVLHIIPVPRKFITADRYMYLPIIGLSLAAIWFLNYIVMKFKISKKYIVVGLVIYISSICTQSFYRTMAWENTESLKLNINELLQKNLKE